MFSVYVLITEQEGDFVGTRTIEVDNIEVDTEGDALQHVLEEYFPAPVDAGGDSDGDFPDWVSSSDWGPDLGGDWLDDEDEPTTEEAPTVQQVLRTGWTHFSRQQISDATYVSIDDLRREPQPVPEASEYRSWDELASM